MSLGASGTYEGVTASANTQFGYSMSQQSGTNSAATLFQCNAAAFSYNLKSFSNAGPSALDADFLSSTINLIKVSRHALLNLPGRVAQTTLREHRDTPGQSCKLDPQFLQSPLPAVPTS